MRPSIVELLSGYGLDGVAQLLPTPGILYGAATAAVILLFLRRSRQVGLSLDLTLPAAATGAVCALFGARLFQLVMSGRVLEWRPAEWFDLHGVSSWGACMGAVLGAVAYLRAHRLATLPCLDAGASSAGLAVTIARLGCFLAGCDFGQDTSLAWGIHYPAGSPAFDAHVAHGLLVPGASQSLAVHPLPIYLSLNALVLFVILSTIWRRTRHRPGITLAAAWILYGVSRFFWEFLRDPAAGGAVSGISLSQTMALVSVGIGLAVAVGVLRRAAPLSPSSAPAPAS